MNGATAPSAAISQNGRRIDEVEVVLFGYPPYSPALLAKNHQPKPDPFFKKRTTTGYLVSVLQKLVFSLGSSLQPPFDRSCWFIECLLFVMGTRPAKALQFPFPNRTIFICFRLIYILALFVS
jgi:hypothetical protein